MSEIAGANLSSELGYKLEMVDGKLKLSLNYDGKGAEAGMSVSLEPSYFLDKLAALIPGQIDDMVIAAIKAALAK